VENIYPITYHEILLKLYLLEHCGKTLTSLTNTDIYSREKRKVFVHKQNIPEDLWHIKLCPLVSPYLDYTTLHLSRQLFYFIVTAARALSLEMRITTLEECVIVINYEQSLGEFLLHYN
jgi:hypothetical protein